MNPTPEKHVTAVNDAEIPIQQAVSVMDRLGDAIPNDPKRTPDLRKKLDAKFQGVAGTSTPLRNADCQLQEMILRKRAMQLRELMKIDQQLIAIGAQPMVEEIPDDASPDLRLILQAQKDFCVAVNDTKAAVFVNGKICQDPKLAKAEDFFLPGLHIPRNTSNLVGSTVTPANVVQIPGLNTLGISLVRIDYAPYGQNAPHTHPRASEILFVMEGTLYVGFVTSNPENRLISKILHKGDAFVFPEGLIHFQINIGETNAVAFAGLSSQNPGVITIANAVFGSNPPISDDLLTRAFQLDKNTVDRLQGIF